MHFKKPIQKSTHSILVPCISPRLIFSVFDLGLPLPVEVTPVRGLLSSVGYWFQSVTNIPALGNLW